MPDNLFQPESIRLMLIKMVSRQCGYHIVRRSDENLCKVQIYLFHRKHLGHNRHLPAPTLRRNKGYNESSQKQQSPFLQSYSTPKARPIETVVLPIPALVIVMAKSGYFFFTFFFINQIRWNFSDIPSVVFYFFARNLHLRLPVVIFSSMPRLFQCLISYREFLEK